MNPDGRLTVLLKTCTVMASSLGTGAAGLTLTTSVPGQLAEKAQNQPNR